MRTVVACNSNAMPRESEEGLPEDAGLEDDWHQLVTWKSRSARAAHSAKLVVGKFVEAWVAVKRMRGGQEWRSCLKEGKVLSLIHI